MAAGFCEGEDAPLTQGRAPPVVNGLAQRIKGRAPRQPHADAARPLHAMHLGTAAGIDRALERLDLARPHQCATTVRDLGPGIPICARTTRYPQFEKGESPDAVKAGRHRR